jgi:hypothetical protein
LAIQKNLTYYIPPPIWESTLGGDASGPTEEGVTVVLNQQMGNHDLRVVEVKSVDKFREWATNFLAEKFIPPAFNFDPAKPILEAYLKDDIRFFLIDCIKLSCQQAGA